MRESAKERRGYAQDQIKQDLAKGLDSCLYFPMGEQANEMLEALAGGELFGTHKEYTKKFKTTRRNITTTMNLIKQRLLFFSKAGVFSEPICSGHDGVNYYVEEIAPETLALEIEDVDEWRKAVQGHCKTWLGKMRPGRSFWDVLEIEPPGQPKKPTSKKRPKAENKPLETYGIYAKKDLSQAIKSIIPGKDGQYIFKHYIERKETEVCLKNKTILLLDKPGAGKTFFVCDLLERISFDCLVLIKPGFSEQDIRTLLSKLNKEKKTIVFWDDLHELPDGQCFLKAIDQFRGYSENITMVAAARSDHIKFLTSYPGHMLWEPFLPAVHLASLSTKQYKQLIHIFLKHPAKYLLKDLSREDIKTFATKASKATDTPSYIASVFKHMSKTQLRKDGFPDNELKVWQRSFKHRLSAQEQAFIKTLNLLQQIWMPFNFDLVKDLWMNVFRPNTSISDFQETVASLRAKHWIEVDEFKIETSCGDIPISCAEVNWDDYASCLIEYSHKIQTKQFSNKVVPRYFLATILARLPEECPNLSDDIEDLYSETVKNHPKDAFLLGNYGLFLLKQDKIEKATECYKEALKIKPNDIGNLCNYGILLTDQEEFRKAEKHFKKVLKIDPNHIGALCNYGFLWLMQDKLKRAGKYYGKVLEINSDDMHALFGLGFILIRHGKFREAEECFGKALASGNGDKGLYQMCTDMLSVAKEMKKSPRTKGKNKPPNKRKK